MPYLRHNRAKEPGITVAEVEASSVEIKPCSLAAMKEFSNTVHFSWLSPSTINVVFTIGEHKNERELSFVCFEVISFKASIAPSGSWVKNYTIGLEFTR